MREKVATVAHTGDEAYGGICDMYATKGAVQIGGKPLIRKYVVVH